ncbi:effector-associated constant component EACC1 [Streptomyces phaeochromogenes]|uniref:effector-associated constant component EACC1 n=1 Tax=Streptomyces phaeochromogenes TaxID=1923 RepID=UPI003715813C
MEIRITMDGTRHDTERRSLYKWLCDDRELRGIVEVAMVDSEPEEPDTDTMGSGFDTIAVVLNTALQLGGLAVAIAAWRQGHAPRSTMVIERDGVRITLPDGRLDDAEALLRALEDRDEDGEGRR